MYVSNNTRIISQKSRAPQRISLVDPTHFQRSHTFHVRTCKLYPILSISVAKPPSKARERFLAEPNGFRLARHSALPGVFLTQAQAHACYLLPCEKKEVKGRHITARARSVYAFSDRIGSRTRFVPLSAVLLSKTEDSHLVPTLR